MGQGGAGNGARPLLSYRGMVVQAGVGQQNKAVVEEVGSAASVAWERSSTFLFFSVKWGDNGSIPSGLKYRMNEEIHSIGPECSEGSGEENGQPIPVFLPGQSHGQRPLAGFGRGRTARAVAVR